MHSGSNAPAQSPFNLGYRPALDGFRGIGVLIILGAHSFLGGLAPLAMLSLQTFFILSGFLITVLLLREWERYGTISLRNFYIRRALRLLPALVAFLAVATLAVAIAFPEHLRENHYRGTFAALFYFYNWALIYGWISPANVHGHCWTLSVEEQFYLLWPLVLIAIVRMRISRRWKLGLVAMAIAASVIERALMLWNPQVNPWRVAMGSDMQADSILLGCLIGMAACWHMLPSRPETIRTLRALAALSFVALIGYSVFITFFLEWLAVIDALGGQGVRALGIGFMFVTLLVAPPNLALRILELPVFVWFGRRSYTIYLWHLAINAYFRITTPWSKPTIAITSGILAVAVAAASFRWIESPFLRMKVRYSTEPAAAATPIAQTSGIHDAPAVIAQTGTETPAVVRPDR